ncbi:MULTISPECIES: carboxymuconolactone decarboxylase family protein [Gammaproteobacteria]|uniref:carboxymuconolactone decarboxylase family protein n=1 Tax=Gammaproteobacteria TaxID=1236 RepID=UPI00092C1FBC|nr:MULTISPECIES: carboxymuconolactone decarboxylase family protein [Gammaproteobacteria]MBU2979142.1 carboxymuconolactone decarboxylase family protein [Alteromonas sp. C1M14]SIN74666.1 4-carboxymuconolactone decarboxylase [Salinivibrio sp. ES.052]
MDTKEQHLMELFAKLAPQFYQLTEEVLFGQVWRDENLSLRDRSLITVTALVVLNRVEQLPGHLARACSNGLTVKELSATMTHLAFYAGWPVTASALERLDEMNHKRSDSCQ